MSWWLLTCHLSEFQVVSIDLLSLLQSFVFKIHQLFPNPLTQQSVLGGAKHCKPWLNVTKNLSAFICRKDKQQSLSCSFLWVFGARLAPAPDSLRFNIYASSIWHLLAVWFGSSLGLLLGAFSGGIVPISHSSYWGKFGANGCTQEFAFRRGRSDSIGQDWLWNVFIVNTQEIRGHCSW